MEGSSELFILNVHSKKEIITVKLPIFREHLI